MVNKRLVILVINTLWFVSLSYRDDGWLSFGGIAINSVVDGHWSCLPQVLCDHANAHVVAGKLD
jgi:hypothetical protein